MRNARAFCFALAALLCGAIAPRAVTAPTPQAAAPVAPTQDYLVYVVCESADKVVLLRFGPLGLQEVHQTHIGIMPVDINGPHGIAISPDKQFVYVSVGHGRPDGSVWKMKAGTEEVVRYAPLGLVSRDGGYFQGWRISLRRQREFSWRYGALFGFRGCH